MIQHARVGRSPAHRARGAVVVAGETRVGRIMSGEPGPTTRETMMIGRRISVDHGGRGRQRVRMVMAARISRRILTRVTRPGPGHGRAGHVSVHVAGKGGREISVMMAWHPLGPVGMVHGPRWPVVMGHVRGFRVPVMVVGVLSLKSSHQPVPDSVQIRGPSKVVGVLVDVRVRVAVEMSVDVALGRGRLVMVLIRIQNLLNILQLVFAGGGGRFLR